jgi:hypothetical protein
MVLVVVLFLVGTAGIAALLHIVRRARSDRQLDHTLDALRSLGQRIELTSEFVDGAPLPG